MDSHDARAVVTEQLRRYRTLTYEELRRLLNEQDCFEIRGPSGVSYQIEIEAMWDDKPTAIYEWSGTLTTAGSEASFHSQRISSWLPTGPSLENETWRSLTMGLSQTLAGFAPLNRLVRLLRYAKSVVAYLRIVAAPGPCDLSVTSIVSFSLLGTGQARYGQICWLSAGRRRVTPSPIPGELFQPNRGR